MILNANDLRVKEAMVVTGVEGITLTVWYVVNTKKQISSYSYR